MTVRWYLGVPRKPYARRLIFQSDIVPTDISHGAFFSYAIGPFRTRCGAEYMRDYGQNNPHCATVAQAEKLAHRARLERS